MSQNLATSKQTSKNKALYVILPVVFLLVAVIGLYIVKWNPYYSKAFKAASAHSIGDSILSGKKQAAPVPSWAAAWGYTVTYFNAVWKAVVLGLLLGSLIQVAIPRKWIKKALGGDGFGSTAVAAGASLPGMMCSCCASPVAVGLRKSSASISAALAFLLGNPTLNPATIIFMGFVLGWKFSIFRIVMGLILVFGISTLASKYAKEDIIKEDVISSLDESDEEGNIFVRWIKALIQLVIDTIPAYIIVVTLLGAARAWLFPVIGTTWSNSILTIVLLAITGTLFVIPTAAEIPIIQTLMHFGLGVGPAGALLMTLPSTSLPSLLLVKRVFPKKVLAFVGCSVVVLGIVSGLLAMIVL
ncbi:permease [Clostridium sp. YIM B02515]|uniref:Permease n=1 Tax=Clostridium rhizosphaerae TaxID=2803861 RepID=A0ABS1T7T8_9CLOT|nr:permease [Clostridium rhizosphaerae]MBL4934731.1 permease [Clostridium rhizosphaerae]